MTLIAPILDDRHFQDIVDEAKKRIPHFCKEWTDHNVSDPGVTLIELFAWMTDIILYRLNQVPDRHYIKFLELLGIKLQEPFPAKAPITFWLSSPQETAVTIPANTEVASTQTESERPIVFTTNTDFQIQLPQLSALKSRVVTGSSDKQSYIPHNLRRLQTGFEGVLIFSPDPPHTDDAFYLGFENDLSHHILRFDLDFVEKAGAGAVPHLPPYIWEASTGDLDSQKRWEGCEVDEDTTKAMNYPGYIQLFLPKMGKYKIGEDECYWVRARLKTIEAREKTDGMERYKKSPILRRVGVSSWGGTIEATHAQPVNKELVGRSDGSPGQRFQLQATPILKRQPGENLIIQVDEESAEEWLEVSDFADSGAQDCHYTLDGVTGELRFGPAIRQPEGTVKLFGAIPPRNARLIFKRYRYGGGQSGNVQAGIMNTLKTAIPYIARVLNRKPAWGGLDPELLESAMMRAPAMLRSRNRAVTEDDFEFLAQQALPAVIGRVKCLQPRPTEAGRVVEGQLYVLVVPRVTNPAALLSRDQLEVKPEDMDKLRAYLDERRLLTTRLDIRTPAYHGVSAKVRLRAMPGVDETGVKKEILARLNKFLNPLIGGEDGKGWPFGRHLFASDVYQCLQGIQNIQFIREAKIYRSQPGGEAQGEAVETVEVVNHGVIASGVHTVEFV